MSGPGPTVCVQTGLNAFSPIIFYIVNCVTGQIYLTPVHAYLMYVSVCLRVVKCFLCAHDGIRVTAVADYL